MARALTVNAPKRRFSVAEYHRLLETGILREDDRVELIHGEIIQMSPIGPKHAGNLDRMVRVLTFLFGESAIIRSQNPILVENFSEPEPDISILRPREDFYTRSHPEPRDVLLIIELSETSLTYDQDVKLPLYAANNIPEYWIVDLKNKQIIVHRDPAGDKYFFTKHFRLEETIDSPLLPSPLSISKLLGD